MWIKTDILFLSKSHYCKYYRVNRLWAPWLDTLGLSPNEFFMGETFTMPHWLKGFEYVRGLLEPQGCAIWSSPLLLTLIATPYDWGFVIQIWWDAWFNVSIVMQTIVYVFLLYYGTLDFCCLCFICVYCNKTFSD